MVPGVVGRASLRQVELVVYFTFFGAAARHLPPPPPVWFGTVFVGPLLLDDLGMRRKRGGCVRPQGYRTVLLAIPAFLSSSRCTYFCYTFYGMDGRLGGRVEHGGGRGLGTDWSLVSGRLVYCLPQNGTAGGGRRGSGRCHHGLALFGLVNLQFRRFRLGFARGGGGTSRLGSESV